MRPPPWKRCAPALRSAGREVSASASVKPQCRTPHGGRQPGRHFNPKDLEIYPRRITVFFLISVGRRSPVVRGALSEYSFLFVPARASPHPCCERAVFVKFFQNKQISLSLFIHTWHDDSGERATYLPRPAHTGTDRQASRGPVCIARLAMGGRKTRPRGGFGRRKTSRAAHVW